MNKYGVLLGWLGTLAVVVVLGLSFTFVEAQEIRTFIPFFGSPVEQQEISLAKVAQPNERPTAIPTIEYGTPYPGEIRPVLPEFLPTPAPIPQEIEDEIRAYMEEQEPEPVEVIIVAGPETKGQRIQVNGVGFVELPADVWVSFFGTGQCFLEMVEKGECIPGFVTNFRRDGISEDLAIQHGVPVFLKSDNQAEIRKAFADVIQLIEKTRGRPQVIPAEVTPPPPKELPPETEERFLNEQEMLATQMLEQEYHAGSVWFCL